jgi:methylglyoxal synthase
MIALAMYNRDTLQRWPLIATATTGALLEDKAGLKVERLLSGPRGGDAQVAARVAEGLVVAVIFLVDPLDRHPHDPDIQGLLRVCNVQNMPLATTSPRPT